MTYCYAMGSRQQLTLRLPTETLARIDELVNRFNEEGGARATRQSVIEHLTDTHPLMLALRGESVSATRVSNPDVFGFDGERERGRR
jgi:hypothetical protein